MVKNLRIKIPFLLLAISLLGLIAVEQVQAAAYSADNLLGQLDGTDSPVYTTSIPDNNKGNGARGFNMPEFATLDTTNHKLYVSDSANARVMIFNLDNSDALIDRVADNILGCQTFGGNCGASNSADHFNSPKGLAYDASNNRLFVADGNNHRISVFNVATIANGEAAVNVLGQANFAGSSANRGGTVDINTLSLPLGLAYDSGNQRLFVSDSGNHRVVVYDVTTIADGENATAVLGQIDFTSGSANRGTGADQNTLSSPFDVAYHASTNRLFVADQANNRVLVHDVLAISNGENAINVLGQSNFTSNINATTRGGMFGPQNLAYGSNTANQLFVSDSGNNRIMVYDVAAISPNGEDAINVLGQALFTTSTQATTQAGLDYPKGLAFSPTGNLLYAVEFDNNRVGAYDVAGITDNEPKVNLLGQLDASDNAVYTTANANNGAIVSISSRGFNEPKGMALDSANRRLFVADTKNNRVLVFNLDASLNLIDRVADNVLGQANFTSGSANRGGGCAVNSLWFPIGLAYDATGNRLFVADTGNNRVAVYDVATIADGEDASWVIGQTNFTNSSEAVTQTGMKLPVDVAFHPANNTLFVTNYFAHRVTVYDVATIANGEPAVNVLGQADFTSGSADRGIAVGQNTLDNPSGLALDATNSRLFIADATNHRVLVYDVRSAGSGNSTLCGTTTTGLANGMNASCVLGQADFVSQNSSVTQSRLNAPSGLAFDTTHNRLYVADEENHRVLVFDTAAYGNGMNAVNVLGPNNFTTATPGVSQSILDHPFRAVMDEINHRLYVSDRNNARVMIYNLARVTTTSLATASQNTSYTQTIATTGSEGVVTFALSSGTLPTGLTLAAGTGVISGTPTQAGSSTFTILATDTGDVGTFTDDQALTLTVSGGSSGSTTSRTHLTADVQIKLSLGTHRDLALVRLVSQLLGAERMIPARVSRGQELGRLISQAPQDITDIIANGVLRALLLRWTQEDSTLRTLLRGQQTEHLIFEVWEVGKVGEPFTPVAKAENLRTNLFGEAQVILPSLKIQAYTFTIRKPYGLRQVLENVTLASPLELTFKQPVRTGDFNGDGVINLLDVQSFITNFKSRHENPGDYDLNEDGTLDLLDFVEVLPALH